MLKNPLTLKDNTEFMCLMEELRSYSIYQTRMEMTVHIFKNLRFKVSYAMCSKMGLKQSKAN